jgi:CO/xanthine dehydrogenase Mo-binding subunit
VAVELAVDDASAAIRLERAAIAADAGQIVDPDGLVNQLEGGFVQAASWALCEEVRFDRERVTSVDWETYPILRFAGIPEVETVLVDRPGQPWLGAGEASQGPTSAAIANAVFDATGLRVRDLPLTPEQLRAAALRTSEL